MPDLVDVLRDRFYDDTEHGPVMVPAGTYPVERDGETLILVLSGYLARAAFEPQRVGEGLYLLESSDTVREPTLVTFRRRIVGDTAEFLSSDLCEEGHPNQRLRVRLEEGSMPEIPVGRVAIGRVVTTEEMLRIIGATEERQRVRTKVEEMITRDIAVAVEANRPGVAASKLCEFGVGGASSLKQLNPMTIGPHRILFTPEEERFSAERRRLSRLLDESDAEEGGGSGQ